MCFSRRLQYTVGTNHKSSIKPVLEGGLKREGGLKERGLNGEGGLKERGLINIIQCKHVIKVPLYNFCYKNFIQMFSKTLQAASKVS